MAVRWLSLEVHAPCHGPKRPSIRLTFILIEEIDPPQGEKPVRWLLATTLPVESLEDALRCVQWYAYRWTIERFHFVLKSGCKIEQRQLETVERMERDSGVFDCRLAVVVVDAAGAGNLGSPLHDDLGGVRMEGPVGHGTCARVNFPRSLRR